MRGYKYNMAPGTVKRAIDTLKIYFFPALDSASGFQFLQLGYLVKIMRIAVLVVTVVILFRRHTPDRFQVLKYNLKVLLAMLIRQVCCF